MINPGKNHLPGMLLFLDFNEMLVGFGVPDKFQFVGDDAHIVPNEETMDFTGFTVGRGLAPAVFRI